MNKDIKVALLAIAAIIMFILGYQFMSGALFHSSDNNYQALFTNVTSLKKSDRVFVNGLQVGIITNISFENNEQPDKIKVQFSVKNDIKIPKNSLVEIFSVSLMGNKGLKINFGNSSEIAKNGSSLIGINEKGILDGLSENMGPLADNSTELIGNVNTLFDRNEKENLYITIYQLNMTLASMQKMMESMNMMVINNQRSIQGTLTNVDKITGAMAQKQNDIQLIISNTRELTQQMKQADISKSLNQLNKNMDELSILMNDVNKGKGSLGKLMKDEELYNKLNATANSADLLLKDMKENPKRYVSFSVFGGKK
jgi:phospholipid/cholesterol/gamma-HCH transport system substrate-binding protein